MTMFDSRNSVRIHAVLSTDRPKVSYLVVFAFSSLMLQRLPVDATDPPDPFNGKSFSAWTTIDGKPVPEGWEIVDGILHLKKDEKRTGHIVTANEYGDFTLSFDWKISPGGNSGLKYRVRSYGERVIGCEYQIYDDSGAKQVQPRNSAGALYDLYEPSSDKKLKPAGEWNQAKIVVRGNRIEHWLNGQQIVTATIGDSEWQKRLSESKFSECPDFSQQPKGKLMLTDHGSEVWYRNFVFEQQSSK